MKLTIGANDSLSWGQTGIPTDDSGLVHKTGNETINGTKTFSSIAFSNTATIDGGKLKLNRDYHFSSSSYTYIGIWGGTQEQAGGGIRVYGPTDSTKPNYFELYAGGLSSGKVFRGTPSGSLTWDNNKIITESDVSTTSSLGVVKVDGTSITINNGVISVPASVGSSVTNWVVNTVANQASYVLSSPILPSSTSSDYNVYLGAGKLSSSDFTITTATNTITLVTAPTEVIELCVQYSGQKYFSTQKGLVKDTSSTSVTVQVTANTEYIYGTLTSLSLTFANGNDGDEAHIMFKTGNTPTTLTLSGSNLAYKSFIPEANKYIEISAKWYVDKWMLLLNQI